MKFVVNKNISVLYRLAKEGAAGSMKELILEVRGVSYQYDNRHALNDVSLQLQRGEMLGLVGQNGSGKSTLLKVMLGLLPLQNGEVKWFGSTLTQFHDWSKIGYVSQKANSFNTGFPASVEEVVAMGLTGKLGLFRRIGRQERSLIAEAIEQVGLSAFRKQNIGELSGGQQQRVFIARSLVSDPEVLILDEPTVGIDAQNEAYFYELLQRLNDERRISIILVSHDLSTVSKQMDMIACLNQRLYFYGTAAQFDEHVHLSHHH